MFCLTPKPSQSFFVYCRQSKGFFFLQKKSFLMKSGSGGLNKKLRESFLTALSLVIKKELTSSIRKLASKLKVHE